MTDIADIDRPATAAVTPGARVAHSINLPVSGQPDQAAPAAALASLTAAQLALHVGWTMAVLCTAAAVQAAGGPPELPTVHQLSEPERRTVELGRLDRLLDCLAGLPGTSGLAATGARLNADDHDFADRVRDLHLTVLGVLAAAGLELELAYELGRSLRDTVVPREDAGQRESSPAGAVASQLARGRIAKLQEWLATLSAEFPPQVAAIVGASMGRWSDFAEVTVGPSAARQQRISDKDRFVGQMREYLLRQGDVWLMLLVGVRSTAGLLTPEGYVTAGEAALRRSARIIRSVLAHYWGVAVCLAAALGGVLYLAAAQLAGASQVWTSIAAIGSTMGISAQSIRSAIGRLSTEAERPVLTAAEEDAKAWAITTLPPADLTASGTRKLRKSGIAKPVGLGRF
jgi:hypothetical protein